MMIRDSGLLFSATLTLQINIKCRAARIRRTTEVSRTPSNPQRWSAKGKTHWKKRKAGCIISIAN